MRSEFVFFLDGELDEKSSERVRIHLQDCDPCSRELQAIEDSIRIFQTLPRIESRREVQRALWERIEGYRTQWGWLGFFRAKFWIPVGAAVALGLLLFLSPMSNMIFRSSLDDELASNPDFLVNYPIIENLDALQALDTIEKTPKIEEGARLRQKLWVG
jgi:hypothetical protein